MTVNEAEAQLHPTVSDQWRADLQKLVSQRGLRLGGAGRLWISIEENEGLTYCSPVHPHA